MEIWKPVIGFEGLYEVSNYGRVRSTDRYVNSKCGSRKFVEGRVLKQNLKGNGYLVVELGNAPIRKTISVHRLVAMAFCEKRECDTQVNHINCNKKDNRAVNLEWCTALENREHAHKHGLYLAPNKNKVMCKQTGVVFNSSFEAAEWINAYKFKHSGQVKNIAAKIRAARLGIKKSAYGYTWEQV